MLLLSLDLISYSKYYEFVTKILCGRGVVSSWNIRLFPVSDSWEKVSESSKNERVRLVGLSEEEKMARATCWLDKRRTHNFFGTFLFLSEA